MRRTLVLVLALLGVMTALLIGASLESGRAASTARPIPTDLPGGKTAGSVDVDVEIILAVDVSYSMDTDEQALQREGYVQAITSSEFLQALKAGMHGRVAMTYVEWAGAADQRVLMPWRLVDGPETAAVMASELAGAPYRRAFRTSISGAIEFSAPLFENNGFSGMRRVIDLSGDGTNNQGTLVETSRDEALAKGITINGLPIMLKRPNSSMMDIDNLDVYYEDCIIGGPGAFVIPIREREKFREATRTKLVLEVAGAVPPARVIPAAKSGPRVSCTIGERMWQDRWGRGGIEFR